MRELHVVAVSEDGRSVVLAASPGAVRGGFRVSVDDISAALRGEIGASGSSRERETPLTPKEIQTRLRAGESPDQIAWSAGVDVDLVHRFSGPVLSERAGVLDAVQGSVLDSLRAGRSALPLGEAVAQHLAQVPHLREGSVAWRARREGAGRWLVELSWVARGRQRSAAWWWDPSVRLAVPVNAASAALAHAVSAVVEPTPGAPLAEPARAARVRRAARPEKSAPAAPPVTDARVVQARRAKPVTAEAEGRRAPVAVARPAKTVPTSGAVARATPAAARSAKAVPVASPASRAAARPARADPPAETARPAKAVAAARAAAPPAVAGAPSPPAVGSRRQAQEPPRRRLRMVPMPPADEVRGGRASAQTGAATARSASAPSRSPARARSAAPSRSPAQARSAAPGRSPAQSRSAAPKRSPETS